MFEIILPFAAYTFALLHVSVNPCYMLVNPLPV